MLNVESKYYYDNFQKFFNQYPGKYLVIHGRELIGAYDTHAIAYQEARKDFKVGTFLIEHCVEEQPFGFRGN